MHAAPTGPPGSAAMSGAHGATGRALPPAETKPTTARLGRAGSQPRDRAEGRRARRGRGSATQHVPNGRDGRQRWCRGCPTTRRRATTRASPTAVGAAVRTGSPQPAGGRRGPCESAGGRRTGCSTAQAAGNEAADRGADPFAVRSRAYKRRIWKRLLSALGLDVSSVATTPNLDNSHSTSV